MLGKLPLTRSRVSYGTPLSVILTYNSVTTSSILTKVSESKRSSMDNMLAKFRSLENVAMETVTNSLFFFKWPISQQGVKVLSWNFGNVCSWTKGTFYVHNTISWELQIFCYNQAKFQPWSCGCQVSYGTLISPILIYNSKTRNRIFTTFSASKRSSLEKMSAKFRRPEIVAMETVTDSFVLFNAQYLSGGVDPLSWNFENLFSKTKGTFYVCNIIFSDLRFSVIIKQNVSQRPVDAR